MITIRDQAVNILNYLNCRKHIVEEPAICPWMKICESL